MIVKPKVSDIEKEDFPDPRLEKDTLVDKIDPELLCRLRDQIAVLEENLRCRETVRFKNKLAFEILDLIERTAVSRSFNLMGRDVPTRDPDAPTHDPYRGS